MILRYRLRLRLRRTEREAARLYAEVERLRKLATTLDPIWDRGTYEVLDEGVKRGLKDWSEASARAALLRAQLNATGGL